MASPIRVERHDAILGIVADNPPVNALGAAVRAGIVAALEQAIADETISAILLRCEGRTFFAGADIAEFGKPMADPLLTQVVALIDQCPKPVVAAVHGAALGGGCELALACHYRIAAPTARLGLPEVKLGLVPGAGGTQRLPRLVGVQQALEMITKGNPVDAAEALAIGLIDRIAKTADLEGEAIAFAAQIASSRPLPRVSQRPLATSPDIFSAFRIANARRFKGFDAPAAAIDCVEQATDLPFAEGLAFERRAFTRLMAGTQSAAQRHLFFAERQAAKIEDVPRETQARSITRVGIIGAGTMGTGIALNFLLAGLPVTMVEMSQDALDRGIARIRDTLSSAAARGRLTETEAAAATALLSADMAFEALAACDLVIEAVYEAMDVKKAVLGRLDAIARPGAILASNTSYLDLDEIAMATRRPQDVVGLHFFSPANIMRLLEIVRGAHTADDVLVTAMAIARSIDKIAVVARVGPGFIGNRLLRKRQDAAHALLLEGASPAQIDKAHVDFGMPMGPFQMTDLAGVDIGWHRDPSRVETIREALCAQGRLGQKSGAGFYDYDAKRAPSPSGAVERIIQDFRQRSGKPQRIINDQEILARTLYPMIDEGARIMAEGKAQRASDIDLAWVHGYGWPAYRGGPIFWARGEGFETIAAHLRASGHEPAPSLRALLEAA